MMYRGFGVRAVLVAAGALALAIGGPAACGDSGGTGTSDQTSETGDQTSETGDQTSETGDQTSETGDQTSETGTTSVQVGDVLINEIAASGDPYDWIELLNRGDVDVDLTGWTLTDNDPTHVFEFAAGASIGAGQYLLVLGSPEQGGFEFGIGKSDAVFLYAEDETVSFVSWEDGDSPKGWSYGRIPDGTGDFESLAYPTPGAPNEANPGTDCGNDTAEHDEVCDGDDLAGATCEDFGLATGTPTCESNCAGFSLEDCEPPTRVIVVNEVRATGDDKIELMNPGDDAVDLTGWWLTDEKDAPTGGAYEFPDGTVMAAGEYLVLEKGLNHVFGLSSKDGVRIRNDDGELIDRVDWGNGDADISYCRIPDGLGEFQICTEATFGEANAP